MPRREARIHCEIWDDDDFLALPGAAQRVYILLFSQRNISLCGLLTYAPRRWSKMSSDDSVESLFEALGVLEEARFIASDPEEEQIFVRSFMRRDGVSPTKPKVWGAAMELARDARSPHIAAAIVEEVARICGSEDHPGAKDLLQWVYGKWDRDYLDTLRERARPASSSTSSSTSAKNAASAASSSPPAPRSLSDDIEESHRRPKPGPDMTGFDSFWNAYPPRNGRKVGKDKAIALWVKLSIDIRRCAYRGAKNLAVDVAAGKTLPPDAHRFLRDGTWRDYLDAPDADPVIPPPRPDELIFDPDAPSIFDRELA